jgi:hypothetical protein
LTSIRIRNDRDEALTIFGISEHGHSFAVEIPAHQVGTASVKEPGTYNVQCDQDETLQCTWIALSAEYVWQGRSDLDAFFGGLRPGRYEVRVFPPRLPDSTTHVLVDSANRTVIAVDLTVNGLPKAK